MALLPFSPMSLSVPPVAAWARLPAASGSCARGWGWGSVWVMGGKALFGPVCAEYGRDDIDDSDRDVTIDSTFHQYHSPVPPGTRSRSAAGLPRYVFGPKPKRRTEFVLLVFGSLLIVGLYVVASLGQNSKVPPDIGPFLGVILGLALAAHMANRWLVPDCNAV